MQDVMDIVKNVEGIYESDTAFSVLKDFERVLDELDLYVYENWEDGELASGPNIEMAKRFNTPFKSRKFAFSSIQRPSI